MALPQGINFRGSSGYVSDGANEDYQLGTSADYPRTSAQGNNIGWETAPTAAADRNNAIDARLAGLARLANFAGTYDYRIDLPASGAHNVGYAAGDALAGRENKIVLLDDSTAFSTVEDTSASGSFLDATGAELTAANWPSTQALVSRTFSSTILRIRGGGYTGGTGNTCFAHIYIESAGASFIPYPRPRGHRGGMLNVSGGMQ